MGSGNDKGGSKTRYPLCCRVRPPSSSEPSQSSATLTSASNCRNSRQKQFNILKPFLPRYFSSEWSHSQFRLPPPAPAPSRLPFSHSSTLSDNMGGRSTPTVEDDVCRCTWIEYPIEDPPSNPAKGKGKERDSTIPLPPPRMEAQIVAVTNSGGWYRISLGPPGDRARDQFGLGKDATSDCRLEEYRRIETSNDGW